MIFIKVGKFVSITSGVVNKITLVRNIATISIGRNNCHAFIGSHKCLEVPSLLRQFVLANCLVKRNYTKKLDVQDKIPALQMKKRPLRKKRLISDDEEIPQPGFWNVKALATAEEYNLETLMEGLLQQDLYAPRKINTSSKCKRDRDHREIPNFSKMIPSVGRKMRCLIILQNSNTETQ